MNITNEKKGNIINRIVSLIIIMAISFTMYSPIGDIRVSAEAQESTPERYVWIDNSSYKKHVIDENGNEVEEPYTDVTHCIFHHAAGAEYGASAKTTLIYRRVLLSELGQVTTNGKTRYYDDITKLRLLRAVAKQELIERNVDYSSARNYFVENFENIYDKYDFPTGAYITSYTRKILVDKDNDGTAETWAETKSISLPELYREYKANKIKKDDLKKYVGEVFDGFTVNKSSACSIRWGWLLTDDEYLRTHSFYPKYLLEGYITFPYNKKIELDETDPFSAWNIIVKPSLDYMDNNMKDINFDNYDAYVYIPVDNTGRYNGTYQTLLGTAFSVKKTYFIGIHKVDENGTIIGGAGLCLVNADTGENVVYQKNGVNYIYWVSSAEPQVFELDEGNYIIKEITEPNGYNKAEDMTFQVTANTRGTRENPYLVFFENTKGYTLPETGGSGTGIFIILGSVILVVGFIFNYKYKNLMRGKERI